MFESWILTWPDLTPVFYKYFEYIICVQSVWELNKNKTKQKRKSFAPHKFSKAGVFTICSYFLGRATWAKVSKSFMECADGHRLNWFPPQLLRPVKGGSIVVY